MYFNIHSHTDYSNALLGFPDVVSTVNGTIQRAYDLGLSGISISEHEGISSHIKALKYFESMKKDRPFSLGLGNEIYLMEEEEDLTNRENLNTYSYYHFILLALDTEGHKQLRELSTRAWLRSWKQGRMYRRPTYYTDLEEIVKSNQGHLVFSSACLGSRIDKLALEYLETNDKSIYNQIVYECQRLQDIAGKENFYLEIQPSASIDNDQSKVNRFLKELSQKLNIKIIPSVDSHYLKKEDALVHQVFLQSQDGEREVGEFYRTAYLMGPEELTEYLLHDFDETQIKQMFEWSKEIGERIQEYDIRHKPIIPQLPVDKIPKFHKEDLFSEWYEKYPYFGYYASEERNLHERYFFYQAEQGLKNKILKENKDIEDYIARLDEEWKELKIISDDLNSSMPSYYVTMAQIIELIWECDSISMPGRGSSVCFLTCYVLEITQLDPVPYGDYLPSWRHVNSQRGVEIADIDNDSEPCKKETIANKLKEYFGKDRVLNVSTFAKVSSKTALEKACKGLGISNDTAGYLKSLIPVSRGKVQSLKDSIYGNKKDDIQPVRDLIVELNKYDGLKVAALGIEGVIISRATHAAGIVICNESYTNYIAAIKSMDGTDATCYDLWDSEEASCVKFDLLSTDAASKIHRTMDYLIKDGKITWEGSLKTTYYKWIHPKVLEYNNPEMWKILPSIYSIFQFDTPTSSKVLSQTNPCSVMDLSGANSLLRLMPEDVDETPIEKYARYKANHEAWVQDTVDYGLNDEEREVLWEYLSDTYGLADSQEKIMRLSMDKRVAGYSLKEANKLRKSVARKSRELQEEAKKQFFEYGVKQGTREIFLDYVWNVVFGASFG